MDIAAALIGQYHAGLTMLRQTVERCPDDLWCEGTPNRPFWRIAFHSVFFTDLYMHQGVDVFSRWPKQGDRTMFLAEPYDGQEPFTKDEILEYIDYVGSRTDSIVSSLDLDSDSTGFPWYSKMNKLDHQIMNVRHLQGHVGQLSEILMAHGIDIDWVGKSS